MGQPLIACKLLKSLNNPSPRAYHRLSFKINDLQEKNSRFRNIITFRSQKLIASAITDEDSFIKLGEYFAYTKHIKVINFNYLAPSIFNNCYSIHAPIIRKIISNGVMHSNSIIPHSHITWFPIPANLILWFIHMIC